MQIPSGSPYGLRVDRKIGQGATASVFLAHRVATGEAIALKIVSLASQDDPTVVARLKREVETLRNLNHPSIVKLLGFHEQDETLALELELIEGRSLGEWIASYDSTLEEPKIWILARLAQALAVAHTENIIHRDLKPENILIKTDGEVKLTDFGLAKSAHLRSDVTLPGSIIGSLAYMAPELINQGESSFATDVFSFGVVGYQLLIGKHPFPHQDVRSLMNALFASDAHEKIRNELDSYPGIGALLAQCMNSNPNSRPESFWEIYSQLMLYLKRSGVFEECKTIVSSSSFDARDEAIERGLEKRKVSLEALIDAEKSKVEPDRKALFGYIREYTRHFPNAQTTRDYERLLREALAERRMGDMPKRALFLLLACVLLCSGVLWIQGRMHVREQAKPIAIAQVQPAPAARLPKAQVETEDLAIVESKHALLAAKPAPKIPPKEGVLDFSAPSDVRVFIDGRRYGQEELRHLKLTPGRHQILMEKDGYLPIEKSIQVKSGKTARIHIGEREGG